MLSFYSFLYKVQMNFLLQVRIETAEALADIIQFTTAYRLMRTAYRLLHTAYYAMLYVELKVESC